MFLMRRATTDDVPTLHKLARMVHFINLPADKDIIADKAAWSAECFRKASGTPALRAGSPASPPGSESRATRDRGAGPTYGAKPSAEDGLAAAVSRSDLFMFALEDTESGGVLGTSQIIAHMGGPGRPNVSLRLSKREMFSQTLRMGATHTVAKLHLDESGPTEIGGLILAPSYRGHKSHLGRFLSLVRFHFIALHRPLFADRIIAELMGPVTPDGQNTLWEYLGRRFINLTYAEADSFCQYSKEFITALMPREEIYLTLLAPEARSVIGAVGPETLPARKMLERLGFAYQDLVDCFDGGPTLEAKTDDIPLIRNTRTLSLSTTPGKPDSGQSAIVSVLTPDGDFRAIQTRADLDGQSLRLSTADRKSLNIDSAATLGFTPLDR